MLLQPHTYCHPASAVFATGHLVYFSLLRRSLIVIGTSRLPAMHCKGWARYFFVRPEGSVCLET